MAIHYLDFDLLIERSGDGYRARVLDSPAGEASGDFAIPFTPEAINNFFVQIGQTRSFETQQTRRIREFGQSLFEAVFTGAVRDRLRSSLGEANLHSNGLRIRLRLSGTPELGNLPWEFLFDPGANRFLALSVETPVVRYLETQQMAQPFAVQPPLRILTMICGPQDYPRLDTEREWENLLGSMRGLQERGLVDLQRLEPPTLSALQQQLRREQYHIFHFIGHGVFSKTEQDGYLLFENAQRGGQRISGHDLGTILHDHRPLRLAVLNACEGARASVEDQFAGTAQSLIQQGIPAVIAMQFRITDRASIMLAYEFYGALADGYPVDAALTEARKAIKTEGNDLEWGTPVLYMRSPDGRIFDIAAQPAKAPARSPLPLREEPDRAGLDRLYTEGLEAYYLGLWDKAVVKFQSVVNLEAEYKDAPVKLELARQRITIQKLNGRALEAEAAGDWNGALQALQSLSEEDPAFPDLTTRTANARRQQQLGDLRNEAEALAQAEKWEAVQGIFREMEKLDPRPADPTGLRARAEAAITQTRLTRELESAYNSALQAMNAGDKAAAMRHLRRVRGLQAGYRETDQFLRQLEEESKKPARAKKEKEPRVKAEPIVTPAHAFTSSALHLEGNLPAIFGLFLAGGILLALLGLLSELFVDYVPFIFIVIIRWLPEGILSGLIFWRFLARAAGPLDWSEKLQVLGASTLGMLTIGIIVWDSTLPAGEWYALCAAYGAVFGAVIIRILRKRGEMTNRRTYITLILAWGLAYWMSSVLGVSLGWALNWKGLISEETVYVNLAPILMSFGAFFGWWLTISALRVNAGHAPIWKTVFAGAAGFALAFLIRLVLLDTGISWGVIALIWGILAGASLAFPSHSLARYLVLGSVVGIIFALGISLIGDYEVLFVLFCGALVGLFLGLDTRRTSGVVICLILGVAAFGLGYAIGEGPYAVPDILRENLEKPLMLLGAGLTGALLAAGWSHLRSVPSPADQ